MPDVRLIDANALKKEMVEVEIVTPPHNHHCSELVVFGYDIDDAPTIDAVPVVRCRECKYYHVVCTAIKPPDAVCLNKYGMSDRFLDPDGYCASGERKEDDHAE